jgi:hypothetical protein
MLRIVYQSEKAAKLPTPQIRLYKALSLPGAAFEDREVLPCRFPMALWIVFVL